MSGSDVSRVPGREVEKIALRSTTSPASGADRAGAQSANVQIDERQRQLNTVLQRRLNAVLPPPRCPPEHLPPPGVTANIGLGPEIGNTALLNSLRMKQT